MKQQKFFVGDVVKRTQNKYPHPPADGSTATITSVELDTGDGYTYLRFKESPTDEWDADFFTLVERAWQENVGTQDADEDTFIEFLFNGATIPVTATVEKEWWGNTKGMVKWRIADEYENPKEFFEQQPEEAQPPAHVALGEEIVAVNSSSVPFHVISNKGLVSVDVQKKNKYTREIKPNVFVDVYDVLRAFNVTDPCLSHLAKKALAAGQRHHKDRLTDLQDIKASIERAIEMHIEWEK